MGAEATADRAGFGRAAVLGAGTMGHGIAHVCAAAGIRTALFDVVPDGAKAGLEQVTRNFAKGVERGKVTPQARDRALSLLSAHDDLAAATDGADIVFEAAPERLELKQKLFSQVADLVGSKAVLATNTSSLSVTKIGELVPSPERVIGTHFFNPVHIMKLLELIVGEQTSSEVVERVVTLGAALGKQTIVVKDFPGFATSRLGLVIGLEAIRMVEQGVASAEDIDKAMTLGYGFPMGPLRLTDLVGLDVRLHIARYLSEALPDGAHFRPPKLLEKMVAEGKLGKKSGQGFYDWSD